MRGQAESSTVLETLILHSHYTLELHRAKELYWWQVGCEPCEHPFTLLLRTTITVNIE